MANILTHPTNGAIYFGDGTAGSSTVPALTGGAVSLKYDGSAGLNIASYNTTSTDRFSIDGSSGRLFSVNDSLTGTIFSVNDAAGLPIIEVESTSSTDTITMGTYASNALVVAGDKVGIGTATPNASYKLDVVGAIRASTGIHATGDLSSSADLDLFGSATISTIAAATADHDKFLVSHSGLVKYRTGTEVISDIGGVDLTSAQNIGGNKTFSNNVIVSGNLTVDGTTTTINSTTVAVDDKNIELGTVATPTDATADGGGITLKGATDKTINWINATDSWTFSDPVAAPGLDINGPATFDTNVNSGGFITHKNSNGGSAAYTSLKIRSNVGGAEIWRNSSTRTQTGGAAQSFNIYNDQDTNIWSGGTRTIHLDTSQNATFAGSVTATSLIKSGGTSSQFLKANGSVDSSTYLTASSTQSKYLRSDTADAATGVLTFSGGFQTKNYVATDDLNSDTRTIFSTHIVNNLTSNRPINYSSVYTLGGAATNALQISTNEDYSESGMWIRQYNSNSSSPQGTGWQNWAEVWTTNHASLSKITNWDTAYTHTSATNNPHSVTKSQVGLSNVTNESKATMFASPSFTGDVVITDDTFPFIRSSTTGADAGIKFSSNATSYAQQGTLSFNHYDSLSYGSLASFTLATTESTLTILADGKLMYGEGIYSKPATGTGAGTRKDSNWDTAYADRNKWDGGSTGLTASTGRTSLGLGSAATQNTSAFAAASHTHAASDITSGTLNGDRLPRPVNGDWWNGGAVIVGTDGVMEVGKYLDFHTADSGGGTDYDVRVTASSSAISVSGSVTATSLIKSGGTSSQFLKANGSVDSNTYLTASSTQSKYLRSDANDTSTGSAAFGIGSIDPDSHTSFAGGFGNINDGGGWGARGLFIHGGGTGDAAAIGHNGTKLYFGIQNGSATNSMDTWLQVSPARVIQFNGTGLEYNTNTVWHAGNDGTGSGLDADLLDGYQATAFQGAITAPNAPASVTTTIVGETIDVTFAASTTSNIDAYLVYSSIAGSDYGLISVVPPDDFSASMSIIDNSFDETGTQAYRVYAMKLGKLSSATTGSVSYTVSTADPTTMSVVNLNNAYYVQWNPPSSNSRFVTVYNVYKHEHATQGSLSRASASLVYSGTNTNYMYQINGTNNNNFHQFWVETTIA